MKEVVYKIEGVSPLLMHNIEGMLTKKPNRMSHEEFEKSPESFKSKCYFNSKDELILHSRVIKGMLKSSAKSSGFKQPGKRANYNNLIKSLIFIQEEPVMDQQFDEVVESPTFVTIQKNKILRIFPKLNKWSTTVKIIIADTTQLQVDILDDLMTFGGNFVGVGDYRPEFGRFTATRIK